MPQSIQLRLEKAANGIVYQVVQEPEKLRVLGIGKFVASNGWAVESVSYPDIDITNKRIFLRGDKQTMDDEIQLVFADSDVAIKQAHQDILTAMEEFVRSPIYNKLMGITTPIAPTTYPVSVFRFG